MTVLPAGTPPAEHEVDEALVAGLLADQHPDLAGLPLRPAASGWDNVTFRLGGELAVRLPRRQAAAHLIEREQEWLPLLAPRLPLPAPAPLRVGLPGRGYPWRWSVLPWLAGEPADLSPPAAGEAEALGAFLGALHAPAPPGAPTSPVRGVPLRTRAAFTEERLRRIESRGRPVPREVWRAWELALAAPEAERATWLHGDLHPCNVLVLGGRISGVIDWGDVAAGDGATDLAAAWMLFAERGARRAALAAYPGAGEAIVLRALGWAVFFGAVLLDTGLVDHPRNAAIGEQTLRRVAEPLDPA